MHYFCTIAEQGQISRAAKLLHMAQPPLSQRLKELEAELGTPLFERQGRKLLLTEAGTLFYRRARDILRAVEAGATGYLLKDTPREIADHCREGLFKTNKRHKLFYSGRSRFYEKLNVFFIA